MAQKDGVDMVQRKDGALDDSSNTVEKHRISRGIKPRGLGAFLQ